MGIRYIERIGEKYNKLKILDCKKGSPKHWYYYCLCDCGNKKWIRSDHVLNSRIKSCGCEVHKHVYQNLIGKNFGRLKVLSLENIDNHNVKWNCICECGNHTVVSANNLRSGGTLSCGCYKKERIKEGTVIHNGTKTRIYKIYAKMLQRCNNKNDISYLRYGGRGIKVCKEWASSRTGFIEFRNWALANGYSDELTIDRIDNDGNYEPTNCRWVTYKVQANNKRNNKYINYKGETHTMSEWSEITGIPVYKLQYHLSKGKELDTILQNK